MLEPLTELIFSDEGAFDRYDMSEYKEPHSAEKLTGSPPGYVGYEEGGRLTNRMRERPFSVLLFDEIEKAHPLVMDKFLQILEDGRLTDSKGQTAYFSQSVIIFTSNIGSRRLSKLRAAQKSGELPTYDKVDDLYKKAVKLHFTREPSKGGLGRPELLGRLGDNIVVFDLLRPEHIPGICNKFMGGIERAALAHTLKLQVAFEKGKMIAMMERLMSQGDNMLYGGRKIKDFYEQIVMVPLNRWVFYKNPTEGTKLNITAGPDGASILVNAQAIPR